ncbi:MAG: hypothetical protein HFJ04_04135 [Lachnospiraceae bacterium]|nr:hypothetical protein [Lachnospiraceae bacterium]
MSKINTVRLINLNYNNNAIRISDEIFRLNGEHTLFSLRNGGGKSVLVQMITAPFVHKRYQNAKNRPFASYFTTNKPTFILVEWKLDQGAGYVLVGMMVRRSQEISEERQDELEVIQFITEYKKPCAQDIFHLPVVEKTKKDVVLKGFHACRQLFESYKQERSVPFFYYDMQNAAQARQYFDKLAEYQIHYKEWETIIRRINQEESGLSNLFADCRDEKGLVEKWFLDAVENKLGRSPSYSRNDISDGAHMSYGNGRIKEFQVILEKYIGQYKDNQSKIRRRDAIRAFEQDGEQVKGSIALYQQSSDLRKKQEGRIADFIRRLHLKKEQEEQRAEAAKEQIEAWIQQLFRLEYEKCSREIYEIMEKESFSLKSLEMYQMEQEQLQREWEGISRRLHMLLCAKQQEEAAEYQKERDKEQEQLLLLLEKEENLEPERKRLGAQLKQYYERLYTRQEAERIRCSDEILAMEQEKEQEKTLQKELRTAEGKLSEQAGALGAGIRAYDRAEEQFNLEYQENWHRNILGEYEAGALQICQAEYEKQLKETEAEKTKAKQQTEACKGQIRSLQREIEDQNAAKIRLESQRKERERQLAEYERELTERGVILQYFNLEGDTSSGTCAPFDISTEKILAAAERKLLDTDRVRRRMEQELSALEQEYARMAQGKVLELSEQFRNLLEEAGIHYVYGMEWLQKNRALASHPFLPYSLILSRQELKRLSALPEQVYTSVPVPILIREELEQDMERPGGPVCRLDCLNFYLWFNENLLEEEKLQQMLLEKEKQIQKLQKSMDQKKAEYANYIGMQEKIKSQKVTKEAYQEIKEEIGTLRRNLLEQEREMMRNREEREHLETQQKQSERKSAEAEQAILQYRRRILDFDRLQESYGEYLEHRRLLEKNRKEKERAANQQRLKTEKISKLEQKLVSEKNALYQLERALEECSRKQARYRQYAAGEKELAADEAEAAENRYEAITAGIGAEQKELERRLELAERRYGKAVEELHRLEQKYKLTKPEWNMVSYNRKEEAHQESLLEAWDAKLAGKKAQLHAEEIQYALLKQEKEAAFADLKERCQQDEPIAKEEILTIDFSGAIKKLEYEKRLAEQEEQRILKRILGYESNLAALAEYEELECTEPIEWEFAFDTLSTAELTKQKGILIRDYNHEMEQQRNARMELERVLNQMIRKEQFHEEFYQKPLEAMLQLSGNAKQVQKQLETTLASYHSLMEKLMVDISLVEKECAKIVELLGDYLREVHEHLGKIDSNSTITVRERPVKMLKIELPDWAENESLYELRLTDFVEDITEKGIALLEENKNVQEYLGTRLTTKRLYDAVVGIGSVQIRLYKIEAQREYPITWADVAKNSGGEGFLSAFVILSSLLHYMRRDETDLFADRNEGKVLLMDNPFAQTNASHLLKPLVDMAGKTNTQLICLSGLGGEAIYNRFDNIYVLTLAAANLRNDLQYVKAERMRGTKEEELAVSQIEVTEQQELIF